MPNPPGDRRALALPIPPPHPASQPVLRGTYVNCVRGALVRCNILHVARCPLVTRFTIVHAKKLVGPPRLSKPT